MRFSAPLFIFNTSSFLMTICIVCGFVETHLYMAASGFLLDDYSFERRSAVADSVKSSKPSNRSVMIKALLIKEGCKSLKAVSDKKRLIKTCYL